MRNIPQSFNICSACMAESLSRHCLKSSPAVIAQKATETAELTGKQSISLKHLAVLRKDLYLNYP